MPAPETVDDYLAALDPGRREPMDRLRAAVNAGAPDATETIAYGMPALRVDGHFLVSYAAFTRHYSLFPASDAVVAALGAEVAPHVAGKGTLRFAAAQPLPLDLITRIVRIRRREEADAAGRRTRRQPSVASGEKAGEPPARCRG